MVQKGYSSILIIIILAILVIGGVSIYYLSSLRKQADVNTPKPIASPTVTTTPISTVPGWQTYKNDLLGFSIAYPNNTKTPFIVEGLYGGQDIVVDGNEDNAVINFPGNNPDYEVGFMLEVLPFKGALEDAPLIPARQRLFGYSEQGKSLQTDFKASDVPTIWYNYPTDNRYEVFLVKNNHAFIFHSGMGVTQQLMEQILSTLKFTQ